jgi:hypothetical protein
MACRLSMGGGRTMRPCVIGLALWLAGCGPVEQSGRDKQSTFEPSKDQRTFVYKAEIGAGGEKQARARLEDWLSEKQICGLGWTEVSIDRIDNRLVINGRCL